MGPFANLEGIVKFIWAPILSIFTGLEGPDEIVQNLEDKSDSLRAMVEDIEREFHTKKIQQCKKRKREEDLQQWVIESRKLLEGVVCYRTFGGKMRKTCEKLIEALASHEKKGDKLLRYDLVGRQGPSHGSHIPVKELIGQVALSYLKELQAQLLDDKIGRIAIHGTRGSGKTILMKNLHNFALKWAERFDYLVWITLSHEFDIKHVQDAIADAVMCDLSNIDDLSLRAQKLSRTLLNLESFVLFLDNVPEHFSLEEMGIPVPTEGSSCKLVITSTSSMVCGKLDSFSEVKLGLLPEADALQLFMHEARIDMGSDPLLNKYASLLAKECCGMPHMIVDVANHMCGIDEICEWRFALFEMKNLAK